MATLGRTILCLAPAAEAAATELAQRRQATVRHLSCVSAAATALRDELSGVVYVLLPLDDATPTGLEQLMDAACESAHDVALGLPYGRSGQDLVAAVRRFAPQPSVADAHASQIYFGADRAYVGDSLSGPPDLSAGPVRAAVAFVSGHSNGIELALSDWKMCARQAAGGQPLERSLPCMHGKECRYGDEEYDLRQFAVDRLVALSCWGVVVGAPYYDSAVCIADHLFRGPTLQALVTTVRVSNFTKADRYVAYNLCNLGLPLGEVAVQFNRYRRSIGARSDLLCFGDPETALSRSVEEAREELGEDLRLVLDPGPRHDWRINIDSLSLEHPISVTEPARAVEECTVAPHGSLYVRALSKAEIRVVDAAAEPIFYTVARELLPDAALLKAYADGVTRLHKDADEASAFRTAAEELVDWLARWPLSRIPKGGSVARRTVSICEKRLATLLDTIGEAYEKLYAALSKVGGHLHYEDGWLQGLLPTIRTPESTSCEVCHLDIETVTCSSPVAATESRYRRECQGCGPIWEGARPIAKPVHVSGDVTPGGRLRASMEIENRYSLPVPARCAMRVEAFGADVPAIELPMTRVTLAPGERTTVEADCAAPGSPGVRQLAAYAVVGASVVHSRRPFVVTTGAAERGC